MVRPVRDMGLCAMILAIMAPACQMGPQSTEPVTITAPKDGASLRVGQPFQVNATLSVDYPIEYVEVRLWDVATNYESVWRFDMPSQPTRSTLSEELVVPMDAPLGEDYRLEVSAMPGQEVSSDPQLGAAFGYSILVRVEPDGS